MARVLVICADGHDRRALEELLGQRAFRVDVFDDTRAAGRALAARAHDLLLVAHAPDGDARLREAAGALPPPVVWMGPPDRRPPDLDAGWLDLPTTAAALRDVIDGALPLGAGDRWSGRSFLAQVDGPLQRFPPARVLFLAHRVEGDGRLAVESEEGEQSVDVRGGRVVGCCGFPHLLASVNVLGTAADDLATALGRAVQQGVPPDRAILAAEEGLGRALARFGGATEGVARFLARAPAPRQPMVLPMAIPNMIAIGLRKTRTVAVAREALAPLRGSRLAVFLPDDAPESRWGLPPMALRVLREARSAVAVGTLLESASGEAADELVRSVELLLVLGLLRTTGAPPRLATAEAADPAPDDPAETAKEAPLAPAPVPSRPEEASTEDVDPRLGQLVEARAHLLGLPAWDVLEITHSRLANEGAVNRQFREVSARFHPDRFANASPEIRRLAEQCFELVGDAHRALQDPREVAELAERLLAAEQGRRYVSPRDRAAARLAYKRGQVEFRKRAWGPAADQFRMAADGDPTAWRHAYAALHAEWLAGRANGDEVVKTLLELPLPKGKDWAEVRFTCGEILLRLGRELQAHHLFAQVVEADPEHIGARRYARLRDMRRRQPERPEGKPQGIRGLFGGRK